MGRYKFRYKQARVVLWRKMELFALDYCIAADDGQEARWRSSYRKFRACRHGFKRMVRKSIRR